MLNIEIRSKEDNLFLKAENVCFTPIRYLFNGRTYEILNGNIVRDAPSFSKRSYVGVALAIITLIPGLIFGLIAKVFNSLQKNTAENKALVKQFTQQKIQLPVVPPDMNFSQYSHAFFLKMDPIIDQIQSDGALWKNEKFVQEFSELMEDGYRYMELYFREVSEKCNHDVKKMYEMMVLQPQNRKGPGQDYSHTFFIFSRLYHYARGCSTRLDRAKWAPRMGIGEDEAMPLRTKARLTQEDQEPYFNPTKPQYRWRQLYNTFCSMLDKNNLRSQFEKENGGDTRFSNWSCPDIKEILSYHSPDTLPT